METLKREAVAKLQSLPPCSRGFPLWVGPAGLEPRRWVSALGRPSSLSAIESPPRCFIYLSLTEMFLNLPCFALIP